MKKTCRCQSLFSFNLSGGLFDKLSNLDLYIVTDGQSECGKLRIYTFTFETITNNDNQHSCWISNIPILVVQFIAEKSHDSTSDIDFSIHTCAVQFIDSGG